MLERHFVPRRREEPTRIADMTTERTGKRLDSLRQASPRAKSDWLRITVLAAHDGIIAVAGLVIAVATTIPSRSGILAVGAAGLLAGAMA